MTENERKKRIGYEDGDSPIVRRIGRRNLTDAESPSLIPSESCKPMDENERHWQDKIERAVTRFQSIVIETCLDAADNGVAIAPYTRDRLTNTSVMIYQFANKIPPLKEEP